MSDSALSSMRENIGLRLLRVGTELLHDAETMLHDPNAAYPGARIVSIVGGGALWMSGILLPTPIDELAPRVR